MSFRVPRITEDAPTRTGKVHPEVVVDHMRLQRAFRLHQATSGNSTNVLAGPHALMQRLRVYDPRDVVRSPGKNQDTQLLDQPPERPRAQTTQPRRHLLVTAGTRPHQHQGGRTSVHMVMMDAFPTVRPGPPQAQPLVLMGRAAPRQWLNRQQTLVTILTRRTVSQPTTRKTRTRSW